MRRSSQMFPHSLTALCLTRTSLPPLASTCAAAVHTMATKPNIIVVGGSYVGGKAYELIAKEMHSTHNTVLVERNTHFNHLFAFPRIAIVQGHEHKAFIPYTAANNVVHGQVTSILPNKVLLDRPAPDFNGASEISYEYLVLATGTVLPAPGTLSSEDKASGVRYFQKHQDHVEKARRIVCIGGGAVGVQMATDIKEVYPEKEVALVHSRSQLMNRFHSGLHDIVVERAQELGVNLVLGERVQLPVEGFPDDPASGVELILSSGRTLAADFVIMCTGQIPRSKPLSTLSPSSIDPKTRFIRVLPTLQIADPEYPKVFALGDVAATGGPKAARPGFLQAQVVANNIRRLANGDDEQLEVYQPGSAAIHMTLGLTRNVVFRNPEEGGEPMVVPRNDGVVDVGSGNLWKTRAPRVTDFHL